MHAAELGQVKHQMKQMVAKKWEKLLNEMKTAEKHE